MADVKLEDLQGEQEIYGSDGQRIGKVGGIVVDPATGTKYLEVNRGLVQDIIGDQLYVPTEAIQQAELGKPVILVVSKREAEERYIKRPADLQ